MPKKSIMLGRAVQLKRFQLGLSRKEFAPMIGFSEEYLRSIECGRRGLTPEIVTKIDNILDVHSKQAVLQGAQNLNIRISELLSKSDLTPIEKSILSMMTFKHPLSHLVDRVEKYQAVRNKPVKK